MCISVILRPIACFLSLVRIRQFSQFAKGIFVSLFISTSNGSVFFGYFMTIKPYILLFLCFYRVCFASIYIFFSEIPTRVFLMPGRGEGYTFYPLSINRGGFFLSINSEKIRLFPSDVMRTYF